MRKTATVLILVLGLGVFFHLEPVSAQTLDTTELDTTGGSSNLLDRARPVRDSKVLKSTFDIQSGSAAEFLVNEIIKLEKVVQGYEELSPAEKSTRDQSLRQIVSAVLDLEHLAERALGAYWRQLESLPNGTHQRQDYVSLFKSLVEENYLERARTYMSGRYQIPLVSESRQRAFHLVEGRIIRSDVDMIVIFKMAEQQAGFRVVDVNLDDTSLEATYRSSFNRIIRGEGGLEKGMPEILRVMQKRLDELKSGEATRL